MKICTLLSFIIFSPDVFAANGTKSSGNGGSGVSGNGGGMEKPDYGDLLVIERDKNGVPVLDVNGCLQPLDIDGNTILLDPECEVLDGAAVVEVEFGRLNLARAPEKVRQQAFDEVIQAIKDCLKVTLDPAGRLALKYKIMNPDTGEKEVVWKTIDAARENLALYTQLMKFGHLQTACNEIASAHGDETTYRPCLNKDVDYPKFKSTVKYLLPGFVGSTAVEPLSTQDLTLASFFLAGAADKSGTITVDLVQYINTILDIPNGTNALSDIDPNLDLAFVNFSNFVYKRSNKFKGEISVIQDIGDGLWQEMQVPILVWLTDQDEGDRNRWKNITGFVQAANDSLQTILFLHNYEIPVPLWTYTVPGLSGAITVSDPE
jgi:hypothetical protein